MTTTDNSRADALTDLLPCPFCGGEANHIQGFKPLDDAHFIDCATCGVSSKVFDTKETAFAAWNLRAASPANQPAAAPVDAWVAEAMRLADLHAYAGKAEDIAPNREALERHLRTRAQPAPSPADERATQHDDLIGRLLLAGRHPDFAICMEAAKALREARDASANETGAEGVLIERLKLLLSGDAAFCRTIVARAAIEQAIAILSRSPAMAAEAVGKIETFSGKHGLTWSVDPESLPVGTVLYAGAYPQPAQADALENISCPHAGVHRYCVSCPVSPCPIGLGEKK
ncbi:Lar family restriction alleviation protein [Burkholderia vietnamiensis]|uniref:Lar family restriction alleviation protein n=1 Tax=Burkholderia vietnamiensis TaxID=60552 RepID=UPI00201287CA|nr:Lar family restriction alleviation protein [Burkholderia vietnamiensis]